MRDGADRLVNGLSSVSTTTRAASRPARFAPMVDADGSNDHGQIPIWVMTEVLDFADVSKAYKGMNHAERDDIARELVFHLMNTA